MSIEIWITIIVFFLTMIVIFWRPRGLNEGVAGSNWRWHYPDYWTCIKTRRHGHY